MATPQHILDEVAEAFGGSLPVVFQRMDEVGELERHWPSIRTVLLSPEPLTPAIVQALMAVFSLGCSSSYCFVMHSLSLSGMGASTAEISELARLFEMPSCEPEHERWGRLLKLAWLAWTPGPHRGAAEFLLRRDTSPAELEHIERVYLANRTINEFTVEPLLTLDDEPMIDGLPEQLREQVPNFVQFHMADRQGGAPRPVVAMCSWCQKIRSRDDEWYPKDAVTELLGPDTLFNHGLCPSCHDQTGRGFL